MKPRRDHYCCCWWCWCLARAAIIILDGVRVGAAIACLCHRNAQAAAAPQPSNQAVMMTNPINDDAAASPHQHSQRGRAVRRSRAPGCSNN
uniref:Putative secreted protein n=1 Tax=Anopheles marajoara TaxID=58244 RepID=A0A2M4CAY2_9DIPT